MRTVTGRGASEASSSAIDLDLLLLVQMIRGAAGEQELGPEQADPFGAGLDHGRHIVEALEIGFESNGHAVGGHGGPWRPGRRPSHRRAAPRRSLAPGRLDVRGRRVDDDDARSRRR